jgi:RNA polymerase sigma-70 factor (ECF subfamily)
MGAREGFAVTSNSAHGSLAVDSLNLAVAAVYREHHASLLAFLNFKLKSPSEANDIAQDAYARVLRHGLPDDIKCARAYVFKTAKNLAINRLIERQRKREYSTVDPQDLDLPSSQPTPEEDAQCRDNLRTLVSAVEELPQNCRKAFILYRFEFLEYKEVAERMNLTESMIRKYVLKGMRHCQRRLEEQQN